MDTKRLLIDAGAAVGLILALVVVFALDGGSDAPDGAGLSTETDEVTILPADSDDAPGDPTPLRLAVTEPEYDDMGKLLDTLGAGYQYDEISLDDLLDTKRMFDYDVIFLTCGGVPKDWLDGPSLRPSERKGSGVFHGDEKIMKNVKKSLRTFVGRGGTLYVSDLHFDLLSVVFPEYIDHAKVARGRVQTFEAEVTDPGLRHQLGRSIELRFDMPSWRPAAFIGSGITTYLEGAYTVISGEEQTGPLLVTFPFQDGMVVFTSFHNEKQNSETELELLRYLVFTTVTAREEAKVKKTMVSGGLSPQGRSLLSVSSASEPISETYDCRHGGRLQFVMGFADQGARLKLTVVGPDGARLGKSGTRTFTIDVPEAAAGAWRYTITPDEVPYRNFPFTLTIGEEQ